MPTNKDELTDEIIANARRDRKRLEKVADGLVFGFDRLSTAGSEDEEQLDSEASASFAEEISSITDSLSKINHELVELVKLDKKSAPSADPVKLGKHELDEVYNDIHPEEVN